MQNFKLVPYQMKILPHIEITGSIARVKNQLALHYEVSGDVDEIAIPVSSLSPTRRDDLWKVTCFEFFIVIKDQPGYWEFNISPSGDWNVYVMDAYRQVNMRTELAFTQLPFTLRKTDQSILLEIVVDLNSIIEPESNLQFGITAVIQTKDGNESYWALAHPGAQADFHLRDSFLIHL